MSSGKVAILFIATGILGFAQQANEKIEFFEARVRPVLANNCYACHTENKLGGLRVDSRVALLQGGKSGPAIVPGRPEESLLIKAIRQCRSQAEDADGRQQAQGQRDRGSASTGFRRWPLSGRRKTPSQRRLPVARAPSSRSDRTSGISGRSSRFRNLRRPTVKDAGWAKTPIDRFILAKLEEKGLKPVQAADKRVIDSPRVFRPDRTASDARAGGRFSGGQLA